MHKKLDKKEVSRSRFSDRFAVRTLAVQKGFNSDISVRGQKYHIQTEDWGQQNPFLVSRIFVNGAVLKTIKTPYETALRQSSIHTTDAIRQALHRQHSTIIDTLMTGSMP